MFYENGGRSGGGAALRCWRVEVSAAAAAAWPGKRSAAAEQRENMPRRRRDIHRTPADIRILLWLKTRMLCIIIVRDNYARVCTARSAVENIGD